MQVGGERNDELSEPIDRLVIALRAYVTRAPKKPKASAKATRRETRGDRSGDWKKYAPRPSPSDWVLVFDCETRTTPDQRLRFGAYQLRYKGQVCDRGAFYEPEVLTDDELAVLRQCIADEQANSDGERICLLTRTDFVNDVFCGSGYALGAQIVGFNLPFDLSRLAIRHASARTVTHARSAPEIKADAPKKPSDRTMAGGFSLTLSEDWPPVVVKHLSQRSAFIRVAGARPAQDDDVADEQESKGQLDRGYFVDVRTLAAALTSKSHSLASLSDLLKVPTRKEESDEHGSVLTPEYVRYGLRDAQTTWECFDVLAQRFATFGLSDTGLYDLYSEASLGKALPPDDEDQTVARSPAGFPARTHGRDHERLFWRASRGSYPSADRVGGAHGLSSMYPTVCTLMGLWRFVRANGVAHRDDTQAIKELLSWSRRELVEHLRTQGGWNDLAALVKVRLKRDLFPVRAKYPGSETLNIGLNYLSAEDPHGSHSQT